MSDALRKVIDIGRTFDDAAFKAQFDQDQPDSVASKAAAEVALAAMESATAERDKALALRNARSADAAKVVSRAIQDGGRDPTAWTADDAASHAIIRDLLLKVQGAEPTVDPAFDKETAAHTRILGNVERAVAGPVKASQAAQDGKDASGASSGP